MGNISQLPQVMGSLKHGELKWSKKRLNLSSLVRLLSFDLIDINPASIQNKKN